MSPSMPSRSVLNTPNVPGAPGSATANGGTLPPGITVAPARPGVSPISGLPTSDIPSVSPGTAPIGPQNTTSAAANTQAIPGSSASTAVASRTTTSTAESTNPTTANASAITAQAGAGVTTVVPTPPPAANPEAIPTARADDSGRVWVPGHYSWSSAQWNWVNGTWQRPPHDNATWIPGQYDANSKQWTEGHWGLGSSSAATRSTESTPTQR